LRDLLGDVPVFPVRNAVLFPGMIATFYVGRQTSLAAMDEAQRRSSAALVLVVAQKNPESEQPRQSDLHPVGCLAEILNRVRLVHGGDKVFLHGRWRARILAFTTVTPYLAARISSFPDDAKLAPRHLKLVGDIREAALVVAGAEGASEDILKSVNQIREPAGLVDLVAGNLDAPVETKVRWLAAPLDERIGLVADHLKGHLAGLRAK
jgi:ATP-dependent Lon protease